MPYEQMDGDLHLTVTYDNYKIIIDGVKDNVKRVVFHLASGTILNHLNLKAIQLMIKKSNKKFHRDDEFTLDYLVKTDEKISEKKGEAKRFRFMLIECLLQLNLKLKTLCCNTLVLFGIVIAGMFLLGSLSIGSATSVMFLSFAYGCNSFSLMLHLVLVNESDQYI
jgi:hypothetical protein